MNNNIVVILILSLLSFLVIISLNNYIFAQYTGGSGGGETGASSLEEQLKLAQEKLKAAGQEGKYGLGYSIPNGDTSQTENKFNCDFFLDRSYGIEKTSSRSNLTFNDSINIVSFSQPDDWNSFTISGKIPSLNWDFNGLVSINNYASASFIVVSLPQIPTTFTIPKEQFESILSSPMFSQFFTIKDSSGITFGNNYYGYFYDISINEEQIDKISLFLPYIQKPLESIVIFTEVSGNDYLIILSTDFYPKDYFKNNSSSTSQLDIYENQFCQILNSIRFEPLNNNLENNIQLNVPDKVIIQQPTDNTTTFESKQGGQLQQLTADITLTILEGSSIHGNPDYEPDKLTVKKGDTILVKNADPTMPHTVTNGKSSTDPNSTKIFDTGMIMGGESAILQTEEINAGEYPYYCSIHPYMTGTLTIE